MQKMKNNKAIVFSLLFILVSAYTLIYFFNDYLKYEHESRAKARMDLHLKELSEKIKEKKYVILTAAILLSKDKDVKECLSEKRRINCAEHLKNVQETFNSISFSKETKIHLHSKELTSFFRLWELDENANDPLSSFRESLLIVKESKKELSGVEIGRSSLLLRGISPVVEKDEYLGSIEVITNFNSIAKYYRNKGINFYVLMHKRYEDIVNKVHFGKNRKIGNYIVVNEINSGLNSLENIDFKNTDYVKKDNHYILYTPIFDIIGNEIGFYVLKIPVSQIG